MNDSERFAVIATGGKQYLVRPGSVIRIEKLDSEEGKSVEFSEVLLFANGSDVTIGKPTIQNALVKGEVVKQDRAKKVHGVKFKAKKRQKTTFGHRQHYTEVRINEITS